MITFEEIQAQRTKYAPLVNKVFSAVMLRSLGQFSRKIRAITMAYDEEANGLKVTFFYEAALTAAEMEAYEDIYAVAATDLCFTFNLIDFFIEIAPENIDLRPKIQNWGWVFKRLE